MAAEYLTVEHLSTKDLIRIFSKISVDHSVSFNETPCWLFTSSISKGYAHIYYKATGKYEDAHRLIYAWLIGPIPRRVTGKKTPNIDHLCRRKACVNPLHLEFGTTTNQCTSR